jgi:hypothetical protein
MGPRRWRPTRALPPHIARLRAIRALRMGAERFDRLADGQLIPLPGRDGYDLPEVARRADFVSRGSAGAWAAWCWAASKPAAEVRRLVASDALDPGRLAVLLDRLEDAWRLGLAARRPRDPAMEYRALLNQVRAADAIAMAREALGLEPLTDVAVDRTWVAGAA